MTTPPFCCQNFTDEEYTYDIMISYDCQAAIPRLTMSIVVAVVAMYDECWLAWLQVLKVCNYELPV